MTCESRKVRCNCLWIPICVTPFLFIGWSCRWSLLMIGVLGGSTWVSHTNLKELSIVMLGHCWCSPQCHIQRLLTISLLMVWLRLCCWLGPPWWWHVGGVSSIVGYLVDAIFGAVAVPIYPLSSVSGVAGLRIIVLEGWHVLCDWYSQSMIPAYLS